MKENYLPKKENYDYLILTHKNPDTDSVCAALALGNLIHRPAVVVGELNPQTEYVLSKAPPKNLIFMDFLTRTAEKFMKKPITIHKDSLLKNAIALMQQHRIRTLPVVNDNHQIVGLVTSRLLSEKALQGLSLEGLKGRIFFSDLARVLETEVYIAPQDDIIRGHFKIAAMEKEDFLRYIRPNDVVITGLRKDIITSAISAGIKKFIITGEPSIPADLETIFKRENAGVILSSFDSFYTAHLVQYAIRISEIMMRDFPVFNTSATEADIAEALKSVDHALPVTNEQGQLVGIISRSDYITAPKLRVILVDHNELSQAIPGLENAEIVEIYDHHRLGDIQTNKPIMVRNEPVGSTCTIIYKVYQERQKRITKKVAIWLLSGILSDTLILQSPTTTHIDIYAAHHLADIANLDLNNFGKKLIAKKLGDLSDAIGLITQDYKEYQIKDHLIGISQLELIGLKYYEKVIKKITKSLDFFMNTRNLDLLILMITDIYEGGSFLYVSKHNNLGDFKLFNQPVKQGMFIKGLFSRKKQLFPEIANALEG